MIKTKRDVHCVWGLYLWFFFSKKKILCQGIIFLLPKFH